MQRLGIFGGSFDPVHLGHLLLAESCCDQAELDEVWFVPNAYQPFKPSGPQTDNTHRLAMLRLACANHTAFKISTIELDRGGISYSFDTLEGIQAKQPEAELFFLMGADSLADFPTWHRPDAICQLATPLVVHRAQTPAPNYEALRPLLSQERFDQIRQHKIEMPLTSISSSQIRALIDSGGAWQTFVPARVADYIEQHQIYGLHQNL